LIGFRRHGAGLKLHRALWGKAGARAAEARLEIALGIFLLVVSARFVVSLVW